jgi:hypothetical protein
LSDFDPATQATIDASIAAANAAEAAGNHAGRAAAATAALDAWTRAAHPAPSAEPKHAVEAGKLLDHLNQHSAAWRNDLEAGKVEVVKEFGRLSEMVAAADPTELAISGVKPPASIDQNFGAVAGPAELVAGAQHLRELGFNNDNVREIYNGQLVGDDGKPLDPLEMEIRAARAETMLEQKMRDPEFRRKILAGEQGAEREWFDRACATIAVGKR